MSMLAVGFLWGATNPLLRLGSKSPNFILFFFTFSLPFIVNQTASILFVMLVSRFPVSIVVPCVNALQFVFTAVIGHLIGEYAVSTILVLVGVLIMMISDTLQSDLQQNNSVHAIKK
ncbi:unnamed protein product [Haemonchus placei]|uniref:Uncharacterized protein n=1 Tax=Haemonchus placei TaxID=6290 RepID=A0A3P7UWD4_HAEPC|nr:unnamed protein product [Haemonchus placei]